MAWPPLICALSCLSAPPALQATAQDDRPVRIEDVIVTARRGAALLEPELELDGARIDGFGAYDISETIARLSRSLSLDQPPILIVNGRRVVNPGDFLGLPPDALERVEVLPQQAGALYGGGPSQRVLNLVLAPRFRSRDARASTSRPTAGGSTTVSLDGRQSILMESDLTQYGVRLSRDTALRGAERPSYVEDNPGRDGVTLRPAVEVVAANITLRRTLGDWAGSLGARGQSRTDRSAALIDRRIVDTLRDTDSLSLNAGLSGDLAGWSVRLALEGQATRVDQDGLRDLKARTLSTAIDLGANRSLLTLPAGPVTANLTGRYGTFRLDSESQAVRTLRSLETFDLGGNLVLPLARAKASSKGIAAILGDASVTVGGRVREAGDAGGSSLDLGASWAPIRKLRFTGQWSAATESPTAQQRFDPSFFADPRIVFDFRTGQAVEVLPLLGGNPDLRPQTSDLMSLRASVGPFTARSLLGGVTFQRASAEDAIGGLPALTPEIEARFPERFQRDANGRLIVVDQRPLNLGTMVRDTLTSTLNFELPVGTAANAPSQRVVRIGLSHTWQVDNRVSLAPGLAELDRLAGDGGGVTRHEASISVDGRIGPVTLNAAGRWRGASRIRRDIGRDGPDDVRLDPLTQLDLKLAYLIGRPASTGSAPAGARRDAGLRLELEIENVFDARPSASLGDGRPAPGYGRDDQDPVGRTVRLTLSRRF